MCRTLCRSAFPSIVLLSFLLAWASYLSIDCALAELPAIKLPAAELSYTELAAEEWEAPRREVTGLQGKYAAAIGFPVKEQSPLTVKTAKEYEPGLYRIRLTVRPSHVSDDLAWYGALKARLGEKSDSEVIEARYFTRVNQPEIKTFDLIHTDQKPLELMLLAEIDPEVVEKSQTRAKLAGGAGPAVKDSTAKKSTSAVDDLLGELTVGLDPKTHFYYLIDKIEIAPLSHSAQISEVYLNKVRYKPGETLHGEITLTKVGNHAAQGKLSLFLEHGVQKRTSVGNYDVNLKDDSQKVAFEVELPNRELGHALIAEYVSADGKDQSQNAEFFNIAANFQRVAISGSPYGQYSSAQSDPDTIAEKYRNYRKNYTNWQEVFAWAEEDMVEMSPAEDVWYSGQTCYRIHKDGLQEWIKQGQEQGWAWTTYGKFIMSGHLGWKTAWDYPRDHRGQFIFPVGMWESLQVRTLDRFRNQEFVPYTPQLNTDGILNGWWQSFLPINPDPTPRMSRIAAEEMIRSVDMFRWDGVRWDGHPRSGGQTNVQGKYDYDAARRTQTLVRYFKDICATKYPDFRHGYNYLFTSAEPSHDWAYEDFEMDELCEGGGLIMNESIRNGTNQPFTWHAAQLQVEGDLCRERGGFYQCIPTDATSERDKFVEMMLYYAGGARPYSAPVAALNRYGTRYSQYTLDETLRRLTKPEQVIQPAGETTLWWEPFVYETQPQSEAATPGKVRRQLVVNLLNVPRDDKPHASTQGPIPANEALRMSPGSEPVDFQLSLPAGQTAVKARVIDPFSLEVTTAPMKAGKISIAPISIWGVLVIDVDAELGTPALAETLGPPKTFGVPRPGLEHERYEMIRLDPNAPLAEAETIYREIPGSEVAEETNEDLQLATMSAAERNQELLSQRELPNRQPENYLNAWWKGATLGADLKLKENPPLQSIKLRRNGHMDIMFARGAFGHRLRMNEAFARFDRFAMHEALVSGSRVNYYLQNRLPINKFRDHDVLIYADVPHGAIGVNDSYALVDYVKAGGGVLLTGGNYSFGKGGYMWTVLDRELLPVQCVQVVDTRYPEKPLPLEPGPDFAELKADVSFEDQPVFWVYNQVALRPDADVKVFLKSGNRPIMVGWKLGEGRVVCMLATQMGSAENGETPYFDWQDWPALTQAVLQWLAPEYQSETPSDPLPAEELASLHKKLGTGSAEDTVSQLLDDLDGGGGVDLNAKDGDGRLAPRDLPEEEIPARVALIETLLDRSEHPAANVLAHQVASVSNLPPAMLDTLINELASQPKADKAALMKAANACLAHRNAAVIGRGYQLLALAGDKSLVKIVQAGPSTELPDANPYRCLAIALYTGPELQQYATAKVAAYEQEARETMLRYTKGEGWSVAFPEQPCLGTQDLLERAALLAYLARFQPEKYAADFAKHWLLLAHYQDYCDLTISSKYSGLGNSSPAQQAILKREAAIVASLKQHFIRMQQATLPTFAQLFANHQDELAAGLSRVKYQVEAEQAIDLLAAQPAGETTRILSVLSKSSQPQLAAFCQARLEGAK